MLCKSIFFLKGILSSPWMQIPNLSGVYATFSTEFSRILFIVASLSPIFLSSRNNSALLIQFRSQKTRWTVSSACSEISPFQRNSRVWEEKKKKRPTNSRFSLGRRINQRAPWLPGCAGRVKRGSRIRIPVSVRAKKVFVGVEVQLELSSRAPSLEFRRFFNVSLCQYLLTIAADRIIGYCFTPAKFRPLIAKIISLEIGLTRLRDVVLQHGKTSIARQFL